MYVLERLHGILGKVWEIDIELVDTWLDELDGETYDLVMAALELLAEHGPSLGRPLVDSISGSTIKNMKELRPGSRGRSELRMLFVFDPRRRAIVLVAGDKAGNWDRWYKQNIPVAEDRYSEHLRKLKEENDG
jgi:hypothetical protein